jgi:formylglycine-generating enzyme required for sulfatase activity
MQQLMSDLIQIPLGPFLLGADYQQIDPQLREDDLAKSLGLGAVLDSTPAYWVDLPEFAIMPRMVTNGQYQQFWKATLPDEPDRLLVDDIQIWEYVWQLYPLASVRVPGRNLGKTEIETYETCQTAIDALVRSYAFECQRLLLGHHVPLGESGYDATSTAVVRVFAMLRRGLGHVIWHDETVLERGEQRALAEGEDTVAKYLDDLELVIKAVEAPIHPAIANQVPLVVLLRRIRAALQKNQQTTFAVVECFRPMTWQNEGPPGKTRGGGLFQTRMPWDELPVRGVSLYEAAAFAAWLRLMTGEPITLPSEAEYEKAFGWDIAGGGLDHLYKHVYPWQGDNCSDFNYWFSRDGNTVQSLEARAGAYKQLLKQTTRRVAGAKLYQGVGFGWQWTRERYNELESKYNRFEHATVQSRQIDNQTVYEYKDWNDLSSRYFSVRGAPDQLGGPGTVTRRFALSPLRGYVECGFRCVSSPAGAM